MDEKTGGLNKIISNYGMVFAFILSIAIFAFSSKHFFTLSNLQNIMIQTTSLGCVPSG